MELLKQSGCGKAVASVRKYYSGSQQVKHNDKEVADAASTLRQRWMEALGKATAPNASGTTVTAGSGEMLSAAPTPSRARSEPASWQSSSKKQSEKLPRSGSGRDSPRQRSSTGDGRAGGQERKSRDDVGGRYGGGSRGDEAQGRPARAGTGTGSGIDEKVAEGDKEKVGAAGAAVAVVKEDVKPPAVVLEEVREKKYTRRTVYTEFIEERSSRHSTQKQVYLARSHLNDSSRGLATNRILPATGTCQHWLALTSAQIENEDVTSPCQSNTSLGFYRGNVSAPPCGVTARQA